MFVIAGAGITGVPAAWTLLRAGAEVVVLERAARPGGVIVTEGRGGCVVEGRPDGFSALRDEIPTLATELGIADRLIDQRVKGSLLWDGKALAPLDPGAAARLLGIDPAEAGGDWGAGLRSFAAGMGELIEALTARLGDALRTRCGLAALARSGSRWRLTLDDSSTLDADGVVLALPAFALAPLIATIDAEGARLLAVVVYRPSVTATLAYQESQVPELPPGTGFISATTYTGQVRAGNFPSVKFAGRAPDGYLLARVFLSPGVSDPAAAAHRELAEMLGIEGGPLWSRVFDQPRALPRYESGHQDRLAALRERLERLPKLAVAGGGVDGAGVTGCVVSGRRAVAAWLR